MKRELVFAFTLLSIVGLDSEAARETHGAVAMVCHSTLSADSIVHAELFDLWEGVQPRPAGHGLVIEKSNEPALRQRSHALEKLRAAQPSIAEVVSIALEQMDRDKDIYDPGFLEETDDLEPLSKPRDPLCGLTQLAVYEKVRDRKKLHINRATLDALESQTDIAALRLHEAIYMAFREGFGFYEFSDPRKGGKPVGLGTSSRVSRQLVATLFSKTELEPVQNAGEPTAARCRGRVFEFDVSADQRTLTFVRIGSPVLSKTQVTLPLPFSGQAPFVTRFPILGPNAQFTMFRASSETEFFVESTGGTLEVPRERVRCRRD